MITDPCPIEKKTLCRFSQAGLPGGGVVQVRALSAPSRTPAVDWIDENATSLINSCVFSTKLGSRTNGQAAPVNVPVLLWEHW